MTMKTAEHHRSSDVTKNRQSIKQSPEGRSINSGGTPAIDGNDGVDRQKTTLKFNPRTAGATSVKTRRNAIATKEVANRASSTTKLDQQQNTVPHLSNSDLSPHRSHIRPSRGCQIQQHGNVQSVLSPASGNDVLAIDRMAAQNVEATTTNRRSTT